MQNVIPIQPGDTGASDDTALPIGTRVADFDITGIVGEGGFGIVYLAFDHALQRTVAIKEYMPAALARRRQDKSIAVRMPRDQKTFETGLRSFINEARILAQFDHPALVKVYRFWEENGTGYMAMRYYAGQTLKSVVAQQPALVTEAWLKTMLKPVLDALDALNRVRIYHRDISPDNILIQENGDAVLLDFGAARQIVGDGSHAPTVILKPGYAPIEQYADDASMTQGPWTDIYSLAAVVYFAIAKKPPPTSVARMVKDPIALLAQGRHEGFTPAFLHAIDRGMAVKPEERPQSIEEFRALLRLEAPGAGVVQLDSAGMPFASPLPAGERSAMPMASVAEPDVPASAIAQSTRKTSFRRIHAIWVAVLLCVLGGIGYISLRPQADPVSMPSAAPDEPQARAPAAPMREPPADVPELRPAPVPTPSVRQDTPAERSAAAPARTAAPKTAAAPATGTVRLYIRPWGMVYVDGVSKGPSPPLQSLVLPEGRHKIQIRNSALPSHTVQIEVSRKSTGRIEYEFPSGAP
jgi:serine/threonine protein kinase